MKKNVMENNFIRRVSLIILSGMILFGMIALVTVTGSAAKKVSASSAKKIALKDAGLSNKKVSKYEIEREGTKKPKYEIEFVYGKYEYSYEIDVKTGKILDMSRELINKKSVGKTGKAITNSKAKSIAAKDSGKKVSAMKNYRCIKKTDDGIKIYRITFKTGNYIYEYEISRTGGKIIDR